MRGMQERIDRATAGLEPSAAEATRARLETLRTDCGCREGALLMVAATVVTVLYLGGDAQPRSTLTTALIVLGVLFGGAAVGKTIGLVIARLRLQLFLTRLERRTE